MIEITKVGRAIGPFSLAALIPLNDPMAIVDGDTSPDKVDARQWGVDRPEAATVASGCVMTYCADFGAIDSTQLVEDRMCLAARTPAKSRRKQLNNTQKG